MLVWQAGCWTLNQGHWVDDTVNGERWELPPRRPYLAVVLLLLVDCSVKRAGEGYDIQKPHPSCDLMFWKKSCFSHCHVFRVMCFSMVQMRVTDLVWPGLNQPKQTELCLNHMPTTFPQGVHQVGVGVLKTLPYPPSRGSSTLPGTPCQPQPSSGTLLRQRVQNIFWWCKTEGVLQAKVGQRAQWCSLNIPAGLLCR